MGGCLGAVAAAWGIPLPPLANPALTAAYMAFALFFQGTGGTITSHDSESISDYIYFRRLPGLMLWSPWIRLARTEREPIPAKFGGPSGPWSAFILPRRT